MSRKKRKVNGFFIALFVVGFLVLAPVWIPIALVLHDFYVRQMRKTVVKFPCTRCGEVLGLQSLGLADAAWGEYVENLYREHPGVKFRLVRTLHAICGNCGQRYTYLEKENTFVEQSS